MAKAKSAALGQFMDVQGIEKDVWVLSSGGYSGALEAPGEFFSHLSPDEQDERVFSFVRTLSAIDFPLQLTVLSDRADLGAYQRAVQEKAAMNPIPALKALGPQYADLAEGAEREVLSERVIFSAQGKTPAECGRRLDRLAYALHLGAFEVQRLDGDGLARLLAACYGGALTRPLDAYLGGWVRAVSQEGDDEGKEAPSGGRGKLHGSRSTALSDGAPRLLDLIAPSAVEEKAGLLSLGGTYARTLQAVSWPQDVSTDWLREVLHFPFPRRVTLHLTPIRRPKILEELGRRLETLEANRRGYERRGRIPDQATLDAIADAAELRAAVSQGLDGVFNTSMLVTLLSSDVQELRLAVDNLAQEARVTGIVLRECWFEEGPAFRSTLPLGKSMLGTQRAVPTTAVAATFPFTAGEIVQPGGAYLGRNRETGGAVILDSGRYGAGHMVIVAPSGGGKSFFVRSLIPQVLLDDDVDVHVIDPSPPIDYQALTELLGGTYAVFGAGSPAAINPCEMVMPKDIEAASEDLPRPVTAKVSFLLALLETMTGAMSPEERALLEEACYAAYEMKGFSDSWDGVLDRERGGLRPLAKRPPTLSDVLSETEKRAGLKALSLRLRPYVKGTLDMFSGPSNLSLDGRMTVHNVHKIVQGNPSLAPAAYMMITEAIHAAMAAGGRRKLILIDEAHVLFQNEATALFMSRLYRMARKTGSRVGLITQSIVDLIGDPRTGAKVAGAEHARVCLEESAIQLLLHNEKESDLDLLDSVWKLSPAERRFLKSAAVGEGLLMAGRDRMLLRVEAPEALYPFITSNPEEWGRLQGVREELMAHWLGGQNDVG